MKLYIAGPMRGIPEFNFPAFLVAAQRLEKMGHTCFNPAQRDIDEHGEQVYKGLKGDLREIAHLGFDLRTSFSFDMGFICREAEGIVLLDGWENSSGAKAELAVCIALGIPAYEIALGFTPTGWDIEEMSHVKILAAS